MSTQSMQTGMRGAEKAPAAAASTHPTTRPRAHTTQGTALGRLAILLYGSTTYVLFLGTFLYAMGFISGVLVPKSLHDGVAAPMTEALLVNGAFLAAFALQHAIMARRGFKRMWTRIVPVPAERATFVLATCVVLCSMFWQWRPMPGTVWQVDGAAAWALHALSGLGWATVLYATFLIDHFELFGLRQVVRHFLRLPAEGPRFRERSLYRLVRHPLMLGFLVAFWSTPHMTWGHLFFATMCTGYIAVGVSMEERDLIAEHGEAYRDYKRRVRAILPLPRRVA